MPVEFLTDDEAVPPPGGPDPDDWRAALPARYPAVSGFLKMLPAVIEFGASTEVTIDGDGKIHLTGLKAVEEPPSLVDLRARTTAMLRVDLPEVLLEVMSWALDMARGRDDVSFALVVGLLGAETHRRADVKAALAGQ
jgi:hypothetical protein